ncbi:MAG: DnaB-like helicase C-terminal domain-containing protein [Candidatus Ratteibacteria bacterium]|jgi:replicative DNA helicase
MTEKLHDGLLEKESEAKELESSVKRNQELASYDGEDKVVTFVEMDAMLKKNPKSKVRLFSGMATLDNLMQGFHGGELIVISGPPKYGKTLLMQTFTCCFAQQNILSLWFSYEVVPQDFLDRFPTPLPPAYLPAILKSNKPDWIEDRILEAKIKYEVQVIFIDHLHFIVDMVKMRNPSLEIGAVLRNLKRIAIQYNVVIVLACHIGKIEKGVKPTFWNLRDSSFISQEADAVLMVWRLKDNKEKGIENQSQVSVELSRRTGVMGKKVSVVLEGGLLKEVENAGAEKENA